MTIKVGDSFPTNTPFKYVPYSKEHGEIAACSNPIAYDLAKELPGKKVVITAAPGAFTPTCTEQHIPSYIKNVEKFKAKGVDKIIVLTANDPFVNAAWGKALGCTDEENYIIFATDPLAKVSGELGDDFLVDLSAAGFGLRTGRYAVVVDNGKVKVIATEASGGFSEISDPKTILSQL